MHTMGKTILLGTTLAVLFAVFMIVPAFAGGHLAIVEAEVDDDEVKIKVVADIPTDGSLGAFGYGAFTTDGKVVAVTTHRGIGPDSETQEDAADPIFHSHLVVLTDSGDECPDNTDKQFEIVSASFEEIADFEVEDNEVEIDDIDQELSGRVVSFKLSVMEGEVCLELKSDIEAAGDDDDDDVDD